MMSRRSGFTLLELLLASALMAVLMIGVLMVLTNLTRPAMASDVDSDKQGEIISEATWIELIRDDLRQAHHIETSVNELVIVSYGGLDAQSKERTQRPVRIRYRIETMSARPWMLRDEVSIDNSAETVIRRELVGQGITRFELIPPKPLNLDEQGNERSPPHRANRREKQGQSIDRSTEPPADAIWRLKLWTDDSGEPVIDRALVLPRRLAS